MTIKKIFAVLYTDLSVYFKNSRIIATFLLVIMAGAFVTQPIYHFAADRGFSIHIAESFLAMFSSPTLAFLIYIGPVLLFCDLPFEGSETANILLRIGRRNWIIAKFLFVALVSATYIFFVLIICMLFSAGQGYFANVWSDNIFAIHGDINVASASNVATIDTLTVQFFSPWGAVLQTILLGVCYSCVIGMIITAFNLFSKKAFGIITALIIHSYSYALLALYSGGAIASSNIQHISLLTHANLSSHKFTDVFSMGRPTLSSSYTLFATLILICAIISFFRIKKYSIYFGDNT